MARQTRQIAANALIPIGHVVSGQSNFPPSNPTTRSQQPDKDPRDDLSVDD
jgi:hypothetical protein